MFFAPVKAHDPEESLFELLVGEGVAEGVDGAVDVAEPVGNAVEGGRHTPPGVCAEAHDH